MDGAPELGRQTTRATMENSQPGYFFDFGPGRAAPAQPQCTPSQQNPPSFPQHHYEDPRARNSYTYSQNGYQQQPPPSHVQNQPDRYYVQPGQPQHPQVRYDFDPVARMYSYDPREMAAVVKRTSQTQPTQPAPASKRQKTGPGSAAGPVFIDLTDDNPSSPQQQPGMVKAAQTSTVPPSQPTALQERTTNTVPANSQPPGPLFKYFSRAKPKENVAPRDGCLHPHAKSSPNAPAQTDPKTTLADSPDGFAYQLNPQLQLEQALATDRAMNATPRSAGISDSLHTENEPLTQHRNIPFAVTHHANGGVTESWRSPAEVQAAAASRSEQTAARTLNNGTIALQSLPQTPNSTGASASNSTDKMRGPQTKEEDAELAELLEQERAIERAITRKNQRNALLASSPPHPKTATAVASQSSHFDNSSASNGITSEPHLAYATPASSSPNMPTSTCNPNAFTSSPPHPSAEPLPDFIPLESWEPPSSSMPQDQGQPSQISQGAAYKNRGPPLCAEQQELVNLILSGRNVFYTGSAGCGKSTVLKSIVRQLRDMGRKVNIIAPTGRAALQVKGSTTWTYIGMTPDSHKLPIKNLCDRAQGKLVWRRLNKTDVLVIDEISMVENHHLERINKMMQAARNRPDQAFGGVQVIMTGDFCQLPPVKPFQYCIECGVTLTDGGRDRATGNRLYKCRKHGIYRDEDKWAFRSAAWEECDFAHFELKQVHRQSDALFVGILQKCRMGVPLSEEDIDVLMNHEVVGVKKATQLHAVRESVNRINRERFMALKTVPHSFFALDRFSPRDNLPQQVRAAHCWARRDPDRRRPEAMEPTLEKLKDHRFEEVVELKHGMLVVLLTNLDLAAGLCNGSQGVIVGWETHDDKNLPKAVRGLSESEKSGLAPDKRLYGDQSMMKEAMITEFIAAQPGYRVDPRDGGATTVEQRKQWPRVKFHNGETRTIYAECSVTELGDVEPYSLLSRTQVPLAPAWAMTIHKAQGMTMDKVVVNLDRAFEEGQVYVALSRARNLEGLKIEGTAAALRSGLGQNREVQQFFREKFGYQGVGREEEVEEEAVAAWCPGMQCPGCQACCGGEEEVEVEKEKEAKRVMEVHKRAVELDSQRTHDGSFSDDSDSGGCELGSDCAGCEACMGCAGLECSGCEDCEKEVKDEPSQAAISGTSVSVPCELGSDCGGCERCMDCPGFGCPGCEQCRPT